MMLVPVNRHIKVIENSEGKRFPYCYSVLIDDRVQALVDSGFRSETADALRSRGVEVVLNTHFHLDHTLKNMELGDVKVWCHRLDAPAIRSARVHMAMYGFYKFGAPDLAEQFMAYYLIKDGPVDRELEDGDILMFGKTHLRVIHTPGHTPGHCVFYDETDGILIGGDINLSPSGPWYSHLCSDLDDLIKSIETCAELKPALFISAHEGLIKDNIAARFEAYRDAIDRKTDEVYKALEVPSSLDELTRKIVINKLKATNDSFYRFFERQGILKHLDRLRKNKMIAVENGVYFQS